MGTYGVTALCSALQENDLSSFVQSLYDDNTSTEFLTFSTTPSWAVCHSPNTFVDDATTTDGLVYVENIPQAIRNDADIAYDIDEEYLDCASPNCLPDAFDRAIPARFLKTQPLGHQDAGARCVRAFGGYLLSAEWRLDVGVNASEPASSVCQATSTVISTTTSSTSTSTSTTTSTATTSTSTTTTPAATTSKFIF